MDSFLSLSGQMAIWLHNEKTVETVLLLSKQRKPDAFLDIEITAEEYERLVKR